MPHIAAFGKLKASDVVMDCGCGDARVLVELARSHKCKCIGWEISPPRLKEAYLNIKANNCGSLVEIREDNGLNCWLLNDSISFIWAALTARGLERVFKVLLWDQGYVPLTEENKNTPGGKRLTLVTFLYKLKSKSIKPVKLSGLKILTTSTRSTQCICTSSFEKTMEKRCWVDTCAFPPCLACCLQLHMVMCVVNMFAVAGRANRMISAKAPSRRQQMC